VVAVVATARELLVVLVVVVADLSTALTNPAVLAQLVKVTLVQGTTAE
jgi:hypothetical protein